MRVHALIFCFALAGCTAWPNTGAPPMTRAGNAWPKLEPLSGILEDTAIPEASSRDAAALSDRAAALRQRAGLMRRNIPDQTAFENLRARLAR